MSHGPTWQRVPPVQGLSHRVGEVQHAGPTVTPVREEESPALSLFGPPLPAGPAAAAGRGRAL